MRYLSSFGEGLGGQIYVASLAGPVYRLRLAPRSRRYSDRDGGLGQGA